MDIIGDWFKSKADLARAAQDLEMQKLIAEQEALKADYQLRTATVQATSSVFKERMFWFLSLPIIYSIAYPSGAHVLWDNLGGIPEWYRTLYATIVLTIWGIPVASGWISNIFSGVTGYLSDRRQDKIASTAVKAAVQSVDKKAFYESLRSIQGVVTDKNVALFDKVLDKMNKGE